MHGVAVLTFETEDEEGHSKYRVHMDRWEILVTSLARWFPGRPTQYIVVTHEYSSAKRLKSDEECEIRDSRCEVATQASRGTTRHSLKIPKVRGAALLACVQQHAQGSAYLSQGFTDGSKGEIAG